MKLVDIVSSVCVLVGSVSFAYGIVNIPDMEEPVRMYCQDQQPLELSCTECENFNNVNLYIDSLEKMNKSLGAQSIGWVLISLGFFTNYLKRKK